MSHSLSLEVASECRNIISRVRLASALLVLFVSACSFGDEDPDREKDESALVEASERPYSNSWMSRHMSARTLDRMLAEYGSDDVMDSPEGVTSGSEGIKDDLEEAKQDLVGIGVLVDDGGGDIRVELDSDEWRNPSESVKEIDDPLRVFLGTNEVTWCGESVDGVRFVGDYTNYFYDSFDTEEEYYASMDDYVDCGDGSL